LSEYQIHEKEQLQEEDMDPYTLFVYGIRSPYTKESYLRRCNSFVYKGRSDSSWAFSNIIRFLHYQKERVQNREIAAGTLRNYVKTLKTFCEVTDIVIRWKKITRGLPKGRRYADDRAPTLVILTTALIILLQNTYNVV
jgi:hypothetical protein